MSDRCIIPLGIFACLLLAPHGAYAEITASLSTETASIFVYEPFTVRLDVVSDAPPDPPALPTVPDLSVTSVRRLPSDPTQRKHGFQIELISERDGTVTLPPFVVRSRGETTLTSAFRLQIGKPRSAREMSLQVNVEPTTLRIGQPANVTVTWTSQVAFERCKQLLFEIPLLADDRWHVFPLAPAADSREVGLPVNNIRVVAEADEQADGVRSLVFRYKLVPQAPFVLASSPARLRCALLKEEPSTGTPPSYFYNHFFEATAESDAFEEIYLTTPLPKIVVKDVATEGRTSHYCGIVGDCVLRASVAPQRIAVGQPALLTVHLDDLDFARHIPGLPPVAFAGMRSEFQLSQEPIRENTTDTSRSFTYVLRPLRSRITHVPAVVIQTFDPDAEEYQTLRSEPIPIKVDTVADDDGEAFSPRIDAKQPVPLHGVRHNRANEPVMIVMQNILKVLGQFWWAFVIVPPVLWLVLRPVVQRWERCRRDPVFARAVTAWRRYRINAHRDEELAWRTYLADRLALCAEALTAESVADALQARRVDPSLIAEARGRFEDRDAVEYGRRSAASSQHSHSLVRQLQKATVPLLLLAGLVVPVTANAEQADALFARAMQMRGERPDEAQTLFVDAGLQFEAEEQYSNAGNSWFFAGENGRALANYRAAERRAPFDSQLRESIEFLRANRTDAFPSPTTPTGVTAAAWTRFGNWDPVLRMGAFVVGYLVAWMVFLASQLTGWRIPRSVWVVLLVVAVLPLASLTYSSFQASEGVVIEDCVARLGPGYAYDPAFKQPLHKATEFVWLENRNGWVHVLLPDDSEGWLREFECMKVK